MLPAKERLKYFLELKELLIDEKIKTVIDSTYPLSKMEDAHKYVEKGHKKGNIVINVWLRNDQRFSHRLAWIDRRMKK